MLDEKASKAYDCATCTRPMQKIRNCDGQFQPATLRMNKRNYQQCPVSIYLQNIELKQMVGMYMHARNRKMPFAEGAMMSQTNWYYEFSSLIETKINQSQNDHHEEMKKDMEKQSKKNKTKKGRR